MNKNWESCANYQNQAEKNKKLCTKVDLAFINDTSFRELLRTSSGEWNKHNNAIKAKFTTTALNVIKRHV